MKRSWLDICHLGNETATMNDIGDPVKSVVFSPDYVFCSEKSVTRTEYYSAAVAGMKPAIVLIVKAADYNNERYVKYEDIKYTVIRTYQTMSEDIELILETGIHNG